MISEQQILELIRKLTPNSKKYLHDDVAILENNLVLTTDSLIENTHFTLKDYKPEEIGWKSVAVNLSDVASIGAKPLYALISLSISKKCSYKWLKTLYRGIVNCSKKYKVQIVGGNVARSKEINITVTIIGKATSKNNGLRSNAKPGDVVFATGTFGDSALGLYLLNKKNSHLIPHTSYLINTHKVPIPQIKLGQDIVRFIKRVSLMDASDGLADCLIQIAKESKVKIIAKEKEIPLSKDLLNSTKQNKINPYKLALYGGEDYQLVGTVSKKDIKKLKKFKEVKIIGEVVSGKGAFLKQSSGKIVRLDMEKAFKHFLK